MDEAGSRGSPEKDPRVHGVYCLLNEGASRSKPARGDGLMGNVTAIKKLEMKRPRGLDRIRAGADESAIDIRPPESPRPDPASENASVRLDVGAVLDRPKPEPGRHRC